MNDICRYWNPKHCIKTQLETGMELAKSFSRSLASLLEQFHPKDTVDTVQRCPEMSEVPWKSLEHSARSQLKFQAQTVRMRTILYFHHLSSLRFHRIPSIPSSKCLKRAHALRGYRSTDCHGRCCGFFMEADWPFWICKETTPRCCAFATSDVPT